MQLFNYVIKLHQVELINGIQSQMLQIIYGQPLLIQQIIWSHLQEKTQVLLTTGNLVHLIWELQ